MNSQRSRQPDHRPEHVLCGELRQRRLEIAVARGDQAEQRAVELASEDGGHVDHVGQIRQPVETLGEQAVEGRRHHVVAGRLPGRVGRARARASSASLRRTAGRRPRPSPTSPTRSASSAVVARRRGHRSHLGWTSAVQARSRAPAGAASRAARTRAGTSGRTGPGAPAGSRRFARATRRSWDRPSGDPRRRAAADDEPGR